MDYLIIDGLVYFSLKKKVYPRKSMTSKRASEPLFVRYGVSPEIGASVSIFGILITTLVD